MHTHTYCHNHSQTPNTFSSLNSGQCLISHCGMPVGYITIKQPYLMDVGLYHCETVTFQLYNNGMKIKHAFNERNIHTAKICKWYNMCELHTRNCNTNKDTPTHPRGCSVCCTTHEAQIRHHNLHLILNTEYSEIKNTLTALTSVVTIRTARHNRKHLQYEKSVN